MFSSNLFNSIIIVNWTYQSQIWALYLHHLMQTHHKPIRQQSSFPYRGQIASSRSHRQKVADPRLHPSDPKHQAFWSSQHWLPPAFPHIRNELIAMNGATGRHQILKPEGGTGRKNRPRPTATDLEVEGKEHCSSKYNPTNWWSLYQLGWGVGHERTRSPPGQQHRWGTGWLTLRALYSRC